MPPKRPQLKKRRTSFEFYVLNTPKEDRMQCEDKWNAMTQAEKKPFQVRAEKDDLNFKMKRSTGKYVNKSTVTGKGKTKTKDHDGGASGGRGDGSSGSSKKAKPSKKKVEESIEEEMEEEGEEDEEEEQE